MNARILAGTLLLLSASATAAAQPYASDPGDGHFAGPGGASGVPMAVRGAGSGPEAASVVDSDARTSVLFLGDALFPADEAASGLDGRHAETVLAGALENAPSGNLVAALLGPLFPGRTDWSTPLPRDLPVTPFVTSAPGWPGAWSVGVKLPRGQ